MTNEFDPELRKQNAKRKAERAERERIAEGQRLYREWLKHNPGKVGQRR